MGWSSPPVFFDCFDRGWSYFREKEIAGASLGFCRCAQTGPWTQQQRRCKQHMVICLKLFAHTPKTDGVADVRGRRKRAEQHWEGRREGGRKAQS
mmetsp:Transcript_98728/g.205791  ORF Transcript_98728/g.205791 Transcript_98728/m.205791 type:complete len:95 (-) Transcript_98728:81-365(-)